MISCRQTYAEIARDVKENRKLTYKDLMELSGFTKRQVGLVLKGERGVAIEKVEQFLVDLGVVIVIEECRELRDWY